MTIRSLPGRLSDLPWASVGVSVCRKDDKWLFMSFDIDTDEITSWMCDTRQELADVFQLWAWNEARKIRTGQG